MHILLLVLTLTFSDIPAPAQIIAMCESGNTITIGTHSWTARSMTHDGGAWQFNDATWAWLMPASLVTQANQASPQEQYTAFVKLWDDGRGYQHWASSRGCWGRYFDIIGQKAVLKGIFTGMTKNSPKMH